ncbi:hypothetical protein B0H11DRAFT_2245562 [Mycena galericulata]|nr:hypothetical protein B0H11DRAFT_2245562 [Mycena galericulata]
MPPAWPQRRDFQSCPEEDANGSPLTGHGVNSNSDGSGSQVFFICNYDDGAGQCSYLPNGTLSAGSSECPTVSTQTSTGVTSTSSLPPTNPALPATSPGSPPITSTSRSSSTAIPSHRSKNSLSVGAIVGLNVGVGTLLFLLIMLCICIRRRRRKQYPDSEPHNDVPPVSDIPVPVQFLPFEPVPVSRKALPSTQASPDSSQNQQEYLIVHAQPREVQRQLESMRGYTGDGGVSLEESMQQNEALRTRIRTLEQELQAQLGMETFDHSPPGYHDLY